MVGTWKCTTICLLLSAAVAAGVSISNGLVEVGFNPSKELSYFKDLALGKTVQVYDSTFRMVVNGTVYHQTDLQLTSTTSSPTFIKTTYHTYTNAPAPFQVDVTYEVKEGWNFFSKKLDITPTKQALWIDAILPYCTLEVDASYANQVVPATFQGSGCVDYAALVRYSDNTGFFLALQNPFTNYTINATRGHNTVVNSSFVVGMAAMSGTTFKVDAALIGTYRLSPYYPFGRDYVNPAERDAISNCVDQFVKELFPSNGVVKVNVGWDENDFQLDVNTQHGVESYERIFDQNAAFGITHVVYAPRNSAISSRKNATDSWGWEEGLWLGLGEHIRQNRWDPNTDSIPPTVAKMLDYAASRNVKLMAYVYPILAFSQNPSWLFTSGTSTYATLASLEFQTWLSDTLIAFAKKANLGGYAFDYTFFNDPRNTVYSQWKGWMTIRANIKNALPDLVIDNRQLDHEYGAWNTLSGSYAEPLMSDENPETYGIQLIPDLHTDRCAANFLRIANFNYRSQEFVPSSRVPGFMFHQTDREYFNGSLAWDDWFIRDFDYLGFKYSLMSNLATAGLNFVACMIPARDIAEFQLFPPEEAQFIRNWFQFAEDNVKYLSKTVPIISAPSLGNVDGTSAIYNNEGFLFLFNPNMLQKSVTIKFDQSINLVPPKGKEKYLVSMMYPDKQNMAIVGFNDSWTLNMDGTSAVVLQIQKMPSINSPLLFGVSGTVEVSWKVVAIAAAMGEAGKPITITVMLPKSTEIDQVLINNTPANFTQDASKQTVYISGAFAGEYFPHAKQIDVYNRSFTGGVVTANFSVPTSVFDQLQARAVRYPIPWDSIDADATWLVPTRLLIYIQIVDPSDQWKVSLELNGVQYPLSKAYNSRRVVSYCFTGFYLDATNLIKPDTLYHLRVTLPTLSKGQFQGIFFENIETIYTDQFISSK